MRSFETQWSGGHCYHEHDDDFAGGTVTCTSTRRSAERESQKYLTKTKTNEWVRPSTQPAAAAGVRHACIDYDGHVLIVAAARHVLARAIASRSFTHTEDSIGGAAAAAAAVAGAGAAAGVAAAGAAAGAAAASGFAAD